MGMTPKDPEPGGESAPDPSILALEKMIELDGKMLTGLDRLAAELELSPDETLRQLMVLRAEYEGTEAVRMMVQTATDLWRNFKMGSRTGAYWAMRRAQREATAAANVLTGEPISLG